MCEAVFVGLDLCGLHAATPTGQHVHQRCALYYRLQQCVYTKISCVLLSQVEEISAAIAHKKAAKAAESTDPLDKLCEEEPDAAECRVYED